GKFLDKEVYFFTDLQQSSWLARQPGALAGMLQKIRAKSQTVFVNVGPDEAANLAVTNLSLGESIPTTGRDIPIQATLQNFGETKEEVSVRLFVGRARVKASEPPCEMREVEESLVQAKLGQQTAVTFKYKFPAPGDYVVQVQ